MPFTPYEDFSRPYADYDKFYYFVCEDERRFVDQAGKCFVCGAPLSPDAPPLSCCSERCTAEKAKPHIKKVHVCVDCGAMLEKPTRGPYPTRCQSCRSVHLSLARTAAARSVTGIKGSTRPCALCGAATPPYPGHGQPPLYCSVRCKLIAALLRDRHKIDGDLEALGYHPPEAAA